MRASSCAAVIALAVFAARPGAAAPEYVVKGSLPAAEGYTVSGTLFGPGKDAVCLRQGSRELMIRPGESFRFVGVQPGHHSLYADSTDGRSRHWEEFDVYADVIRDFVLPTAKLTGKVTREQHGETGTLWVSMDLVGGYDHPHFEAAADGTFESPAIVPGKYDVEFEFERDGTHFTRNQQSRRTSVDVGPDGARLDFDFREPAFVGLCVRAAGDPESFEGRMVTVGGPPMDDLEFRVAGDPGNPGTAVLVPGPYFRMWGPPSPAAPLTNVVRGKYLLRFLATGFEVLDVAAEVGAGRTTISAEMKRLPGSFVNDDFVAPVFEIFVRPAGDGPWRSLLFADNRHMPTHTDPMRPRELLAPGRWEFIATTGDLAPSAPQTVEIEDGHKELKLDLVCVPGTTLHGTLKTPSGAALDEADLHLHVRDPGGWRRLRAKAPEIGKNGGFDIKGLTRGSYRLTFDEAGEHVAGEFEMAGMTITRNFVFRAR
jgi:hypothetical protein